MFYSDTPSTMKQFIATAAFCLFSMSISQAQDNDSRQPENRQQRQDGQPRSEKQDERRNGFPGFPGGGFPDGQNGGFPSFPGGGFPGGPGGFPGMMFGAMGSIEQFGVEFDKTPLKEKDAVIANQNDSTSLYYVENIRFDTTVRIKYEDGTVKVTGETAGLDMKQDGAHLSFHTKNRNVEYILSGKSSNGSLQVKSDHPVKIVLDNVDLTSSRGEAICVTGKSDVYLVLSKGSKNRLEDQFREVPEPKGPFGMPFANTRKAEKTEYETVNGIRMKKAENRSEKATESAVEGVLTSKGLLCVSGNGELTLKGHNKSGMKSKSHMVFRPGNVVNIETTQGKGLASKGDIRIMGGVLNVDCSTRGKDGIRSDECIYISGGRTTVKSGNIEGSEGIEAKYNIVIDDGVVEVASFDDAINSGGNLIVNGGKVFAAAVHNDALDSNSNLILSGGTVVALGSGMPECGLDSADEEGFGLYITGGTIIAMGGMTSPCAKGSTQPSVVCGLEQIDSAMVYSLADESGVVLQYEGIRNYSRMGTILFSSPQLKTGKTYTICKRKADNTVPLTGFHGLTAQTKGNRDGDVIETVESLSLPYTQVGRQSIMMMGPPPFDVENEE